jgi:excisionase family DNA binding protein
VQTVAALTGFTVSTIREMTRQKRFPQALRIGPRTVRWRARDVRGWLQEAGSSPTSS